MPDRETASALLAAANRDFAAMHNMLETDKFAVEVFGFHAQQAAEKSLKAWLSLRGVAYAKTHNLRTLLVLLEQTGADVADLWNLVTLTAFAVQFRYDAYDFSSETLDRDGITALVRGLIERVKRILDAAS